MVYHVTLRRSGVRELMHTWVIGLTAGVAEGRRRELIRRAARDGVGCDIKEVLPHCWVALYGQFNR